MSSIFESALGKDFGRLHPMLQQRFRVDVDAGYACVGYGTFSRMSRAWWTSPFLRLGAYRNILFPEQGNDIPFTIENYPYKDGFGRPTVTFVRTVSISETKQRRFDATMIYNPQSGLIVDYLGTHQHLATNLLLEVTAEGSLHLQSTTQRFYEGVFGFKVPAFLTGTADLYESYNDARGVFTIQMQVRNPMFGFLFGYQGEFTCTYPTLTNGKFPEHLKPLREEIRN